MRSLLSSGSDRVNRRRALVSSFLVSRLVIAIIGVAGVVTFLNQNNWSALNPAAVWNKWDVLWYQRVAENGYAHELDTQQGQAVAGFFPLYPLTVGTVLRAVPRLSFFWVGTTLSNVFTLAALAILAFALSESLDVATRALLVIATSAGSFYLSIPYTESLFLLLICLVMVTTRQRRYLLAAAFAGLAAVTRAQGLAAIAIPLVSCWIDRDRTGGSRWGRLVLISAIFLLPFACFMVYLSAAQGAADAFIQRQAMWDNAFPYPLKAVVGLILFPTRVPAWIHGAFWALYMWLIVRYRRVLPPGELLFCIGVLLISTQQETFHGIYRYTVPLVPLTLALARDRSDVRAAVIGINLVIGTMMILAFVAKQRLAV